MIHWDEPGYVVAFTTRNGGVSEGVYESLNLTAGTGDATEAVEANRRIACETLGLRYENLAFNRQVHSPTVHRAHAGKRGEPGDGLWTDEPGIPVLAMSADCLPIVVARRNGERALAVLHAGWRGLTEGVVAAGVEPLGAGKKRAMIGPAIGPCCYEVGEEVSSLFDADLTLDRKLDLWTAAERALRAAGVDDVDRADVCTRCHPELFFSHRRTGKARGVQGVIGAVA
ncbi:MAG TPA: polyphenol oxidase family protein [Gaiellaceae bacterium]|jgi:YfiH family protein|nr:polyphenol oxidase family protein [Gaiellaceae bacterium]